MFAPPKTLPWRRLQSTFSSNQILSAENMKKTIAKFTSMQPIRLRPTPPAKKAAVLVPLCIVDGKISLLYTLRAANMKSHRGQVSFPGGMQDLNDKSLEKTALRETREELGLPEEDVVVWGCGNNIVTRGDTCVLPVIGHINGDLNLQSLSPNPQEVEEVFTVSLEDLCDKQKLGFTQFRGAYSTPLFLGGQRKIWGLTAMITHMFLRSLLPQNSYSHKIKNIPTVKQNISKSYV